MFYLKQYDKTLLSFEITDDVLEGQRSETLPFLRPL